MSWMNVLGKIFHCTECPYCIKIDYEPLYTPNGPTHLTQIGDDNIYIWYLLHEKYNQSEDVYTLDDDSSESEYFVYLHEEVFCENCVLNSFKNNPKLADQTKKYNELYSNIATIYELLSNYKNEVDVHKSSELDNFINNLFIDNLKVINPNLFSKTLGNKIFKLRGKREELIKLYLKEGQKDIINHLKQVFKNNSNINYFYENFKRYTEKYFDTAKKLTKLKYDKVFYKKDISQPENLNNYISYIYTWRVPKKTTPKLFLYRLIEVDNTEIEELSRALTPDIILEIDEEETIKRIRERLYEIADIKDLSRPK